MSKEREAVAKYTDNKLEEQRVAARRTRPEIVKTIKRLRKQLAMVDRMCEAIDEETFKRRTGGKWHD